MRHDLVETTSTQKKESWGDYKEMQSFVKNVFLSRNDSRKPCHHMDGQHREECG
jgi:hypothetical protein